MMPEAPLSPRERYLARPRLRRLSGDHLIPKSPAPVHNCWRCRSLQRPQSTDRQQVAAAVRTRATAAARSHRLQTCRSARRSRSRRLTIFTKLARNRELTAQRFDLTPQLGDFGRASGMLFRVRSFARNYRIISGAPFETPETLICISASGADNHRINTPGRPRTDS